MFCLCCSDPQGSFLTSQIVLYCQCECLVVFLFLFFANSTVLATSLCSRLLFVHIRQYLCDLTKFWGNVCEYECRTRLFENI